MDALRRLRGALKRIVPAGSLATRTVRSGIWALSTKLSDRALRTVVLLIIVRFLSPEDFGLMAIALLTIAGIKRFSELGIDAALIYQKDDNIDRYLNTAWCLQAIRGLVAGAIIFLSAPFLASFFNDPRLVDILRVVAISPVLFGIRNPAVIYFQKDLAFQKQFPFQLSWTVTYVIVAVALAVSFGTVWALVLGYIAADVVQTIASYLLADYRPRPTFEMAAAKELIGYGKWLTASSMIYFTIDHVDDVVVGWALTATSLGFYQLAYQFALAPMTEVTNVVSTVMFPAYSKLQDDLGKLRNAFFRTVQVTTFVTFPMAVGIIVVAPLFVEVFLGSEWTPMITVLQIIGVHGLFISLAVSFAPIWKALGRPDYNTKVGLVRLLIMLALLVPATTRFGIEGTAAVVVLVYVFPTMFIDIYLLVNLIETSYLRFARAVAYPITASGLMGVAVWLLDERLHLGSAPLELAVLVVSGVVTYACLVLVLEFGLRWGLRDNLQVVVNAIRS